MTSEEYKGLVLRSADEDGHLHPPRITNWFLMQGDGLVVAYGFSDDLLEFHGAMYDEFSCYGGGTVLIDSDGLLSCFDAASEDEDACRRYFERKPKARAIEAVWDGDADGYAWTIKTDIPHETFAILEDGAGFSRGIVFALAELERKAA